VARGAGSYEQCLLPPGEPAYRFIGLLDGKRPVAEAWKHVNAQLGDEAPTQGEVIQLLGQLYTANLLQAEVPADTYTLFARYKKRKTREITGYLMNIMFARLPLVDPDAFLNRWISILGLIFSPLGLVVVAFPDRGGRLFDHELSGLAGRAGEAAVGAAFAAESDPAVCVVRLHQGLSRNGPCDRLQKIRAAGGNRRRGPRDRDHVPGVHARAVCGCQQFMGPEEQVAPGDCRAAGMWVELAIASMAAMVWASTPESNWVHNFSYNVMFVASFSTVFSTPTRCCVTTATTSCRTSWRFRISVSGRMNSFITW